MTQARRDFERLCDRVVEGEEVIITRRGRQVARMARHPDYRPSFDNVADSAHEERVRTWDQILAESDG